jgi:hypothetical protein
MYLRRQYAISVSYKASETQRKSIDSALNSVYCFRSSEENGARFGAKTTQVTYSITKANLIDGPKLLSKRSRNLWMTASELEQVPKERHAWDLW